METVLGYKWFYFSCEMCQVGCCTASIRGLCTQFVRLSNAASVLSLYAEYGDC